MHGPPPTVRSIDESGDYCPYMTMARQMRGQHYVKFIALLVALGSVAGWIIGIRFSWWMNSLYSHFFRFPTTQSEFAYTEAVLAVLVSFVVSLLGAYSAIRRAMHLPPAVAMRPESPKPKNGMITEWIGLTKILSPLSRMIVRRLESNSRATILSVFGMALGLSVLVLGSFMEDTIDYVIDFQFQRAQRQQVMLTFNESLSASAMHDVRHLPGVTYAEPFRAVPVRLRSGPRWHRLSLMGLNENPNLYRVLDDHARPIILPDSSGLTISKKLAEILSVNVVSIVVAVTSDDALLVPAGVLFREGSQWQLFRVVDDRAELTDVQVGMSNGQQTEILNGLSAEDRIVLHPTDQIRDGVRLRQQ